MLTVASPAPSGGPQPEVVLAPLACLCESQIHRRDEHQCDESPPRGGEVGSKESTENQRKVFSRNSSTEANALPQFTKVNFILLMSLDMQTKSVGIRPDIAD